MNIQTITQPDLKRTRCVLQVNVMQYLCKHSTPEPVIRPLSPCEASHSRAWVTPGQSLWATLCKSLRPKPKASAAKPAIIAVLLSRFRDGSEKISLVSSPSVGLTTKNRLCGKVIGFIFSPIPSTQALSPPRKNGTSAP